MSEPLVPAVADPLEKRLVTILQGQLEDIRSALCDSDGNWAVRGFVDVWRRVFPMTADTKVLSKVMEVLLIPVVLEAIADTPLHVEYVAHQNHYPDLTVIDEETGARVAVDLKSTYFTSATKVNGFTLGAFTGYFRERESMKNVTYPYGSYEAHLVLGVLYHKLGEVAEGRSFALTELDEIPPVAGNFHFLVQPKWALATDRPGSGNTKNIGSVQDLDALIAGRGPFSQFVAPEAVFNDYWMNYLTQDMARAAETMVPYHNLKEYLQTKEPPKLAEH